MKSGKLTYKNITFYTRYYKLVAIASLITVAVITGSLVVGDSVRTTLVKRVTERLGNTKTIIFSRNSHMSAKWMDTPLFTGSARGILLTNGFISHNGQMIPVFVWGVDDRSVSKGSAKLNPALLKELGMGQPDAIALRLPATGLIPSGSLFVTENYTTGMRLTPDGTITAGEGGNVSMKNEQVIPFNVFVNREELAEVLEVEGKINLILSEKDINAGELEKYWNYSLSGLSVKQNDGFTEITSDRVFLQDQVVENISRNNQRTNRLFSYLVNSIEQGETSIPYSFVTAMDAWQEEALQKDEIILSDYSAKRIQAQPGDRIQIAYFTLGNLKTLRTDTLSFRVKKIVPFSEFLKDKTLSANFPGLSDVERCTDWDSDLPINMNLISDEDEKYWELYRNTPKAIIAYDAVAGDWSHVYGNATAIRIADTKPDLSDLRMDMFGIQLIYPWETGLYAAGNGVDFSGLFLALGFFIILSAILLMLVPLSEMLYRRQNEISLLKALGYTRKRIAGMLWLESAPVVVISSVAGVITGLAYTTLIMWLLGNVWKGATHTDGFSVYPDWLTVLAGMLAGIALSLLLLYRVIVRNLKEKRPGIQKNGCSLKRKKTGAVFLSVLTIAIIGINFLFLHSVVLFVMVGLFMIGTAALWGDYLICRKKGTSSGSFGPDQLIWGTLFADKKQAVLSFFALATGIFIVFSVGLNRKGFADSSQLQTGTGGYSLWCETSVPIYHDMNTQDGREKLSLTELPDDAKILQCLKFSVDDASCFNLSKVTTPTVLGVDMATLSKNDFRIEQSLYSSDKEGVFERLRIDTDSVYPALVDATVLTWSLGMNLGDTLHYRDDNGKDVRILLAGTLSNSIFQGNILIDRSHFSKIWKETTGSEAFLVKVKETEKEPVKTLLSQALNEYGIRVTTTNDRLKEFNTVTDTYLTIFMTLGGLGLLLGILSFIIVIRKNLVQRRKEIDLYRTLGFPDHKIESILYKENRLVPLYAIFTGVISSLAGVCLIFMNTGTGVWLMALLFTLLFMACVLVFVKESVKNELK